MKERLDMKDTLYISVMLFGLFFGAGNLIFPVYLGYMAGSGVWSAAAGFLVTGVGLPLLGVAALGVSRSSGLLELSGQRAISEWLLLHLRALSNDRAALRHPALRDRFVHRRSGPAARRGRGHASARALFALLLRRGPRLLHQSGKNPHMGRQGADAGIPRIPGCDGADRARSAVREIQSAAPQPAYASGGFAKGFSKATTRWTRSPAWPSASSS